MDEKSYIRLYNDDYMENLKRIYNRQRTEWEEIFERTFAKRRENFCYLRCPGKDSSECITSCYEIYDRINALNQTIQNKLFYEREVPVSEMLNDDFETFRKSNNL